MVWPALGDGILSTMVNPAKQPCAMSPFHAEISLMFPDFNEFCTSHDCASARLSTSLDDFP